VLLASHTRSGEPRLYLAPARSLLNPACRRSENPKRPCLGAYPPTVLFPDLAGFTAFSERQGEEAAYSLMRHLLDLMTDCVRRQGGTVKSFTGDGLMALFGVPVAFEDAGVRACRASLDIQKRIASEALEIEAKFGLRPQMRIGLNTGPIIIGAVEGGEGTGINAIGDTVNLAARLQILAEPGAVVLSQATYRLVRGLVEVRPAGEHEVKGKSERQKIYRLNSIRQSATRFDRSVSIGLTAYVGRLARVGGSRASP